MILSGTAARRPWVPWIFYLLLLAPVAAAPTGPTLHFDYGRGRAPVNPLNAFMYFVPLVSPEPVFVFTNSGNTQSARVLSVDCRTNGQSFVALCEFEMAGRGLQRNVFDKSLFLRSHDSQLKAGEVMTHQLAAIDVMGAGRGSVQVTGVLTNGRPAVTEVRLRFNNHGVASPVSIVLEDIGYDTNGIRLQNEIVARVNQLAFRQKAGRPEMEVTLASVKPKDAPDSFWQNFVGGLKGMAANMFLPPLPVSPDGHNAMMKFGLALATKQPTFTFPLATRLLTP